MPIFQEYPDHEGMMKFIISALFAAAYFALDRLGTSTYAWQAVSDPNTWINSFVTTAMLYCTFDAFAEVFLKRYEDAKPFFGHPLICDINHFFKCSNIFFEFGNHPN